MWVVRFKTGDGAQQVGLFQAYLLMSSLGVALWFGSFTDNPGRWHVIGFLVHTAPLAANLIFWSMITQHGHHPRRCRDSLTFMPDWQAAQAHISRSTP